MLNSIQAKAADSFVAFHGYSAAVCKLRNTSSVSIDYRVGGVVAELAAGASAVIDSTASTSEVEVRRTDLSATPVSVMLDFGVTSDEAYELAAAATDAHNSDPQAHLNIVTTSPGAKVTLTMADSPLQRIKPTANIDVETPALGTAQWYFLLCHGGTANQLTVKKPDGTVLATLIAGAATRVSYDGADVFLC